MTLLMPRIRIDVSPYGHALVCGESCTVRYTSCLKQPGSFCIGSNMGKIVLDNLAKVPQSLTASLKRSKAEYRRLGNSGLRVSNPILGGLTLGSSQWLPWVLNEDKVPIYLLLPSIILNMPQLTHL